MTNSSRLEYIHRVAHFKLNVQPKRASDAFRTGLEKVIPHEWLRMFNEGELQVLPIPAAFVQDISGHAREAASTLQITPVLVYHSLMIVCARFTRDIPHLMRRLSCRH